MIYIKIMHMKYSFYFFFQIVVPYVLQFLISMTNIPVAPKSVKSSIICEVFFFNTMTCIAYHLSSSLTADNAITVGALIPGVIFFAASKFVPLILYSIISYFIAN